MTANRETAGGSFVYDDYSDPTQFAGSIYFPARHDEEGIELVPRCLVPRCRSGVGTQA